MGGGDAPLMDPSICSSFGSLGRPSTFEALPEGLEQALFRILGFGFRVFKGLGFRESGFYNPTSAPNPTKS